MHRLEFRWKAFASALLAALLFNWFVTPRFILPLLERKPSEEPVEIAYVSEDDVTPDQPDDTKLDPKNLNAKEIEERLKAEKEKAPEIDTRPKPEIKKPEPPKPEEKKPELAKQEPPKPEEKKPEVPKPPTPPPPPMPPPPLHQKMVDQDQFPDEADNAQAKYLGQKNHRAKEDTVARNTNLVRNQAGPDQPQSAPSQNKSEQVGGPDQKIAELQKRAGKPHEIVRSQPRVGDEGQAEKSKPGKLSMRGLTPKSVDNKPGEKPREGVELHDNEPGNMPMARQGTEGERAGSQAKGAKRPNLTLSPLDYDKIVGEGVAAAERREAARAEVSRPAGRWDKLQKKLAMMRSSLENFTPGNHIGNESELGTRAHPFAAYIATMHRSIHKLWAFDFLGSLDGKGAMDPLNDMERFALIGIVLTGDGVVEKVTINKPSGYAPFDAAALDAVVSSSPFPPPPETIKSPDGKVYLDWTFHRNDLQCGTDGVYPHILERAPAGKPSGEKHASRPQEAM